MTKKHFEIIAANLRERIVHGLTDASRREATAIALEQAVIFHQFNPRFDSARFLAACGVEA